jgi:hypothetical protein
MWSARGEVRRRHHLHPHVAGLHLPGDRHRLLLEEGRRLVHRRSHAPELVADALRNAAATTLIEPGTIIHSASAEACIPRPSSGPGDQKAQARSDVIRYIKRFYNSWRRHSALGYRRPNEVHYGHQQPALTAQKKTPIPLSEISAAAHSPPATGSPKAGRCASSATPEPGRPTC